MRLNINKLDKCNRKECEPCADGLLHYFYKKYHFLACKDAKSGNILFAALDGKNKIMLSVKAFDVTDFEHDFEHEIKQCVEQLRSAEIKQ